MAHIENFEVNIRTIREKIPLQSQIGIGDDFCLIDIRYDGRQENFGYPCRLDGVVMLFCINGSISLSVNLNEHEIKQGQLIICTAGDIVKVSRLDDSGSKDWRFVMLAMSHRYASELRIDFKHILNEGVFPLETPVISVNENTQEILGDHLKLIARIAAEKGEMYKDSVRSLVSENYSQHRQMTFYADRLCLSPKYLSKLVKEVSGKSTPEWIESHVMLEAKHLLKYSHMSIKEVVYRLHFPNQTAFYKYFKAHTGMTPTDYRNS